jgi:hypothetical protein
MCGSTQNTLRLVGLPPGVPGNARTGDPSFMQLPLPGNIMADYDLGTFLAQIRNTQQQPEENELWRAIKSPSCRDAGALLLRLAKAEGKGGMLPSECLDPLP